jgi:protein tyrosine kinase modulator
VRQQIDELKKRQAEELARVRGGERATGSLASSLKSNPVYQSLEIEMKRTEVQIAEARQELAGREARIADLRRKVNTVPEVEAELARLNRDYEVTRQRYLELVQRLETANISERADKTGTVKFEIIEPPAAPLEPVAPNRPILFAFVLVVGLGSGAALAWLLNQLKPVFHTARSLAEITGLPVLAAVSRTWVDRHRQQRRMELLKFCTAAALLIFAFGMVLMLQQTTLRQLIQ